MLDALLHGKLSRDIENMEDVLTSCVFGALRLSEPEQLLLPWLRLAMDGKGYRPLAKLPDDCKVEYKFWPMWREPGCIPCEPDVVLRVTSPTGNWLILVEAKLRYGKSSPARPDSEPGTAPHDQLAREWHNLLVKARGEAGGPWHPVLVYLTAGTGYPRACIEASLADYRHCRGEKEPFVYGWLSWRHLYPLAQGREELALCDLHRLLTRLGLFFYQGVPEVAPMTDGWRFRRSARRFVWGAPTKSPSIEWSYRKSTAPYRWIDGDVPQCIEWRVRKHE
jgi:hypothetical protein